MSTNFYYKVKKGPFAALAPLHVGLRAGGWVFQFQAFSIPAQQHEFWDGSHQLCVQLELPDLIIKSAADWKAFMAEHEGEIIDEYNMPLTQAQFWEMIERLAPATPGLRNAMQNKEQCEAGPPNPYEMEWRDAQGYPMSLNNFS